MVYRRNFFRRLIGRFACRPYISPTRNLPPMRGAGFVALAIGIINASR